MPMAATQEVHAPALNALLEAASREHTEPVFQEAPCRAPLQCNNHFVDMSQKLSCREQYANDLRESFTSTPDVAQHTMEAELHMERTMSRTPCAQIQDAAVAMTASSNTIAQLTPEEGYESPTKEAQSSNVVQLSRPCVGCRLSRVRCSRELPCGRCKRLGLVCKIAPAQQRGRPSKQARVIKMLAQAQQAQQAETQQEQTKAFEVAAMAQAQAIATEQAQAIAAEHAAAQAHAQAEAQAQAMAAEQARAQALAAEQAQQQMQEQAHAQALKAEQAVHAARMAQAQLQAHVAQAQVAQAQAQFQVAQATKAQAAAQAVAQAHAQSATQVPDFTHQTSLSNVNSVPNVNSEADPSPGGLNLMTVVTVNRFQQLLKVETHQAHLHNQLEILRLQVRQLGAEPLV